MSLYFTIYLLFNLIKISISDYDEITTYYKTFNVYQYNNVGSLFVITHSVEQSADHVLWSLIASADKPLQCPTRNITVYIQHGSIPVAQYENNSTFGAEFMLSRSYLQGPLQISTNSSSELIDLLRPPAGTWFLAMFLDDDRSQVIKKITNVDCRYRLQANVTQLISRSVGELSTGQPLTLNVSAQPTYLRFYVSKTSFTAQLMVDCGNASLQCPVVISIRGAGLPLDNVGQGEELVSNSGTLVKDCTNQNTQFCILTAASPDIDQWQYVSVRTTNNTTMSVTATASTTDIYDLQINPGRPAFIMDDGKPEGIVINSNLETSTTSSSSTYISNGSGSNITSSSNSSSSSNGSSQAARSVQAFSISSPSLSLDDIPLNSFVVSTNQGRPSVKLTANDKLSSVKVTGVPSFEMQTVSIVDRNQNEVSDWSILSSNSSELFLDNVYSAPLTNDSSGVSGNPPVGIFQLYRVNDQSIPLYTTFGVVRDSSAVMFLNSYDRVVLARFDIDPFRDIGSTLKVKTGVPMFDDDELSNSRDSYNQTLSVCIQKSRLPLSEDGSALSCSSSNQSDTVSTYFVLDDVTTDVMTLIPFPESGPWFIGAEWKCYRYGVRVTCDQISALMLQVYTYPCGGGCYNGAKCTIYGASIYQYAACGCIAGYNGFTCADASEADELWVQLVETLLLTLSNLCFIPAICVAIYRRRPAEAVVYTANMFFSSFYHACDMSTWSVYVMCIMPYHVLSFCDFLCSLLSFWVTLIAVARVRQWTAHTAHILAAILLAMAVKWNTHGLITNIVPIVVGCVVVIISWAVQSYLKKHFYPGKRAVLWLIPGILLAGLGLILFAFVETDSNYPYTHSSWHVCISLSIVFLLPTKRAELSGSVSYSSMAVAQDELEDIKLVHSNGNGSELTLTSTASTVEPCSLAILTEPCGLAAQPEPFDLAALHEPCGLATQPEPYGLATMPEPCSLSTELLTEPCDYIQPEPSGLATELYNLSHVA